MTGPQTLKAIVKGEQPRDMSPAEQLQALKGQIDGMQGELQRVLGPRVSAAAFVGAARGRPRPAARRNVQKPPRTRPQYCFRWRSRQSARACPKGRRAAS